MKSPYGSNSIGVHITQRWRKKSSASAKRTAGSCCGKGTRFEASCPFLFEGRLPDLNIGTADGDSCSAGLQRRLVNVLDAQRDYSYVLNGRFKGGYITRHFGKPSRGVDAIQLELAQLNYMDEDTFEYDDARAAKLQSVIKKLLEAALG